MSTARIYPILHDVSESDLIHNSQRNEGPHVQNKNVIDYDSVAHEFDSLLSQNWSFLNCDINENCAMEVKCFKLFLHSLAFPNDENAQASDLSKILSLMRNSDKDKPISLYFNLSIALKNIKEL